MKKIINLLSLIFLTSVLLTAQETASLNNETTVPTEHCTLTVELTNLESDKGQIMVGLYNSKGTWLNNNYKGELTTVQDGKATVVFKNVPFGTYAISSVHDKDMDGKLKTGWFGIPKEPYASSRGAKGRFGPPKWTDAVFTLSSKTSKEVIKF